MSYVRGFAPWIVYALLSAIGWQWGALAALVVAVVSLIADRRKGVALDAQILDFGSLAYFAGLTAFSFADTSSPIQHFDGPLASAWLALIAVISLLVRRPFTQGIARRKVSVELAADPRFVHTNMVITSIWTTAFAASAMVGIAADILNTGTMVDIARQVLGLAIPMYFTHRYVTRIRARKAAAEHTALATAPNAQLPTAVNA
ncbi:hypothetical protein [Streptomyces silvisoli]|uniref:Uncharacterized protein n=1 Tax=Streptomyces silvisoli TaxID=3034235 RepID=A0ABT5ZTC7_9ACTN|nr:hypothetical protein [Streptomyces silvisoli]MDF3293071.1 hypothetical protein [Streptomyces silvisoli]